jgi:3-dehydroquinate dehydratase-2
MKKILILNGPNLNMLGKREPEIYGENTLKEIEEMCKKKHFSLEMRQSNYEGDLVTWVQETPQNFDGLIINPGAYTHTSVALLDALLSIRPFPIVEVHLSIPCHRESFRYPSITTQAASVVISGLKASSYLLAIDALFYLES